MISKTYAVTPEQWEAAKLRLAEHRLALTGDMGEVERDGYRVGWAYGGGSLRIDLLKKPFFVPAGAVMKRIEAALAAEGIYPL